MAATEAAVVKQPGVSRQEFGALEVRTQHETAAIAIAKQAEAETNARYLMAMRNPRDIEEFRDKLLKECSRPCFVKDSLQSGTMLKYALPRGKDDNGKVKYIEGLTIRFVEVALRCFKNILTQTPVVFESEEARIINVTVTDLESNIAYSQAVVVNKTVERKGWKDKRTNVWEPPKGKTVISSRLNSEGDMTYLVHATEEEVFAKQNSLISKTVRTLALRMLPGDIVDEALATAELAITDKDRRDPDKAKRDIIDRFSTEIQIGAKDLSLLLGHSLDIIAPSEMKLLRGVYAAIKSGESSWQEMLDAVGNSNEQPADTAASAARQTMADKLKAMQAEPQKDKSAETKPASAETKQAEAEATKVAGDPKKPTREPGDDSDTGDMFGDLPESDGPAPAANSKGKGGFAKR